MKILIVLFLCLNFSAIAQQIIIRGKVVDRETSIGLQDANITLKTETTRGTTTDKNGEFKFIAKVKPSHKLIISYIGFETRSIAINELINIPSTPTSDGGVFYLFYLDYKIIPSQTVLVEATVGKQGVTPLAFDQIKQQDIEKNYTAYDIPKYLSELPSTTFYSESGNGIGYNYLSIRGFDQRRITVSINGIPQNDPEDHNVYWLDFPDLLASTELIQVQRGAGSGVFGYPAIGGSINLITSSFSNKPKLELTASYGSYVTKKFSAAFSSGLIDNKYSVYAKLGKISSSGYKNKTWTNFNSYYLSAVRYVKNFTTQFNFYGGPIADGLGYTGVAKFAVRNKILRRANYSYWEADENGYTYTLDRRPEEIENFSQPHFELLNDWQISDNLKFNSALFLLLGDGFFDYDASWSVFYDDYFRLRENGFDTSFVPTNALIRAKVENTQYGWIPRFGLEHENGMLFFGAEMRKHKSIHWGSINYAENLPTGVTKDYKYYFYRGGKDIASAFVHESYNLNDNINILGELQLAYHNYKLNGEKYLGNEFSVDNLFLNPRVGINYKPVERFNLYFSFARVSREPRLKEYYDAAESSGGEVPQFELNPDGTYNFDKPLTKPETMNDFELGASLNDEDYSFTLNFFYMLFNDEIVKKGQVDRFGQPITGNVDKTVHLGAELSAIIKLFNDKVELFGNATASRNTIEEGKFFINADNFINLNGNKISGFPDYLANFGITYQVNGLYFRLTGKYVGEFFSDNYDSKLDGYLQQFPDFTDYSDNLNEAY
ncbi:MAG: TonB-dependent receptor, partial [Ignavibacteria bacterium]|nr:TonB-dependent receptor [Ignavibacteria bacterium]